MSFFVSRPFIAALIAFSLVGFSTYLAENGDIKMAGFVAALPIAIPVTLVLKERGAFDTWTLSFLTGLGIYAISALVLHRLYKKGYTKKNSVIISMMVWLGLLIIAWYAIKYV